MTTPVMSEETRLVVQAMDEATWKAIEGYRQTGLPVPCWRDGKVVYLTVDEALASRSDYQERMGKPPPSKEQQ
jgi:hypothetical protein